MERTAVVAYIGLTAVPCIDIDNPECLCDACRDFFENGLIEVPVSEVLTVLKFNPFDLEDISRRINSND